MTTTKTLCISSDSHVVEPPELFEPLVKRFGEEAPHIVHREDIGPQMYIGDGRWGFVITGFLQAGFDVGKVQDIEVLNATFQAYIDWTGDYCKEAPDRLFGLACVQLYDLDAAIA